MKFELRIFVDGYETTTYNLKDTEIRAIRSTIYEYFEIKKLSGDLEMTRYEQPVILYTSSEFIDIDNQRISLSPYNFHKKLDIQFDYIDDNDAVHYCYDIWCDGRCGTLPCGCIDVCRGCGAYAYDN